jgi:hypothetical protein
MIMRSGYVLLCNAAGPGVNMRLQDAHRHSWTISSFFFRVPLRESAWLPQWGHACGCLCVSDGEIDRPTSSVQRCGGLRCGFYGRVPLQKFRTGARLRDSLRAVTNAKLCLNPFWGGCGGLSGGCSAFYLVRVRFGPGADTFLAGRELEGPRLKKTDANSGGKELASVCATGPRGPSVGTG